MKTLLASTFALVAASGLVAQTTVYSTSDFGSGTTGSTGWYIANTSTASSDFNGSGSFVTAGSKSTYAIGYFETPGNQVALSTGETLSVTLDFTLTGGAAIGTSKSVWIGLYNSGSTSGSGGSTQITSNIGGLTSPTFDGYTGYSLLTNPAPSNGAPAYLTYHDTGSGSIALSTTPQTALDWTSGVSQAPSTTFTSPGGGDQYQLVYSIQDVGAGDLDFTYTLSNQTTSTTLVSASTSQTGLSGASLTTSFDAVDFGVTSTQTVPFTFTSIDITEEGAVPEPATYALVLGVAAIGYVVVRRRRLAATPI